MKQETHFITNIQGAFQRITPGITPGRATHPRIFTVHNGNMPFNVLCIV